MKIDDIKKRIKEKNAKWKTKENHITILDEEEKRKLLGVTPPEKLERVATIPAIGEEIAEFAAEVDWRTSGHITSIKNQGPSAGCVAFATTAVMESMALIEKSTLIDLSEADLLFCSSHGETDEGWWPSLAFESVKLRGVCDELCFPFVAGESTCTLSPEREARAVRANKYYQLSVTSDVKNYLSTVGPMTAIMAVYSDFFYYDSGIYKHVTGTYQGLHCITLAGYSDIDKCSICKNSWGSTWGEDGYFRLAYGDSQIDMYDKNGCLGIVLPSEPLPPPPPVDVLFVNPTYFNVTQIAGKAKLNVSSNTKWTASSNMLWCSVTPTSGTDNGILTIAYNSNSGPQRTASITISTENITVLVQVTQQRYIRRRWY